MPLPLTLGLNLPYVENSMDGQTPRWADIRSMAVTAEALGFDALWVSDHLGFGDPDGEWSGAWESWTLLSALATVTDRVRLGTYVAAAPLRNPALLAKMAVTLDEVSGGRVVLGIGAGWNAPEFRAFGIPFDHRFDRFEDGLRIITAMLRDGRSDHAGRYSMTQGARLKPHGPRPSGPPVMLGGAGRRMLRLAAELADEWNGGMRSPADLTSLLVTLDDSCRAIGRDPASIPRSAEVLVRTVAAPEGMEPESHELVGTPADLADALAAYARLGVHHLQVQLRPNTLAGLAAFKPVMGALAAQASSR